MGRACCTCTSVAIWMSTFAGQKLYENWFPLVPDNASRLGRHTPLSVSRKTLRRRRRAGIKSAKVRARSLSQPGTKPGAKPDVDATVGEEEKAYRLHDQLCPHQTIRAVLQKLLNGVLVRVPGHRSGLTDEETQRRRT